MPEVAARVPKGAAVVEFGAGSATKTPILLEAIAPAAYVPVDISGDYLEQSAAELQQRFPGARGHPGRRRFRAAVHACPAAIADLPKLGFFPGSTIGNFVPRSATDLLRQFRDLLGAGAQLLIGMDRVKPVERLIAAYDDPEGVTAEFNLNLLERINRELDGDIPVDAFRHEARWNDILSRIEMHLVATRDVEFSIAGQQLPLRAGRVDPHREQPQIWAARRAAAAARRRLDADRRMDRRRPTISPMVLAEAEPERFAP